MNASTRLETLAVRAGRGPDPATGAVTPNLVLATTFERAPDGTLPHGFLYGRYDNPNRHGWESALAALEGGREALAFGSGQAATAAVLHSLEPGALVLLADDIYHGTLLLVRDEYRRWGLRGEAADFSDLPGLARRMRADPPRVVWFETPSNPCLKIADIAAVCALAREVGALAVVDNTWATPVLTRPLELGAHLVVHSSTKYLGGHCDVTGGAVVLGAEVPEELTRRLRDWQRLGGAVPSPFDCWLLQRSLATLPLRVRAQSASAAGLAEWLDTHPRVERVNYPGLPTHPGQAVAQRQMAASGGMLSFQVRGGFEATREVVGRVRLITRATSLGGVESLIEHRKLVEPPGLTTPDNLIRLSVGLEHPDDLRADLAQALAGDPGGGL